MHSTLQPGQDNPSPRALAQRAKVPKTHSMTSGGPSRVHKLTSSTCPGGQVDLAVVVKPQNFGQLLSRPVAGPKQGRGWGLGGPRGQSGPVSFRPGAPGPNRGPETSLGRVTGKASSPQRPPHPHHPLRAGGVGPRKPRSRAAPIGRVFRCGLAGPGTPRPRVPTRRCPPRPSRLPPRIPTKGRGGQVAGRGGEWAGREPTAGRGAGGAGALTCAAAAGSGRARADPSGARGAGGRRPGRSGGAAG